MAVQVKLGKRPSSMGASGERAAEKKEAVDRTTFNAATALNATNPWWPAIGLYRRVIRGFFVFHNPDRFHIALISSGFPVVKLEADVT